jgi:hypothetical protein
LSTSGTAQASEYLYAVVVGKLLTGLTRLGYSNPGHNYSDALANDG